MSHLRFRIYSINKKKAYFGVVLLRVGIGIILLNALIAFFWEDEQLILAGSLFALCILALGEIIRRQAAVRKLHQGYIIVDSKVTTIREKQKTIRIINQEYNVEVSDLSFVNQPNFQFPGIWGAFTASNGLNYIRLFNSENQHEHIFCIKKRHEMKSLEFVLKNNFKTCKKSKKVF